MRGRCRIATFAALVTLAAFSPAAAQQATYNDDVHWGQWKAVRLRNVPEDAVLAVLVKLEGQIGVAVICGEEADKRDKSEKTPADRGQRLRRARPERPRDPGGGGHDRRAQPGGAEEGAGGAPAAGAAEARRPTDRAPPSRRA